MTPPNFNDEKLLTCMLNVLENDIVPMTQEGVKLGNKIFGAAVLRKSDYSLVLAETNNEMENPLWHGEVHLLKRFYEMDADKRPPTSELIFLTTHEPCTMCMSAITWAGFDNYFYFFSHVDSKDAFAIPHDLKIMKELYGLDAGGYNRENAFFTAKGIIDGVNMLDDGKKAELLTQIGRIAKSYDEMSATYQDSKSENDIPLS